MKNYKPALNYCAVTGLEKDSNGKICGVKAKDTLDGNEFAITAKAVINATGVFANDIIAMDEPNAKPRIVPAQGIHLVLDRDFLPGDDALMVPKTSDGRVLFAVPWHDKLVVGTTDTLVENAEYEPKPIEQEVQFILDTAKDYFKRTPTREDVRSVYVGLRPLAAPKDEGKSTKEVSRSHKVEIANSKLVHIFGGKWTTYRQMAEDTVDAAIKAGLLPRKDCQTVNLKIHGYVENKKLDESPLSFYGSDEQAVKSLAENNTELAQKIHPELPYTYAQIEWAIMNEAAHTLEDVLSRRMRILLLNARAAGKSAQAVAEFMAARLNWSEERTQQEITHFNTLVEQYTL